MTEDDVIKLIRAACNDLVQDFKIKLDRGLSSRADGTAVERLAKEFVALHKKVDETKYSIFKQVDNSESGKLAIRIEKLEKGKMPDLTPLTRSVEDLESRVTDLECAVESEKLYCDECSETLTSLDEGFVEDDVIQTESNQWCNADCLQAWLEKNT